MSETKVLLCSDLDRTLLPNGPAEESPEARPLLRAVAARPELTLAYVSGRHLALLQEAIAQYGLPEPDYAVGDVGTTIYEVHDGTWRPLDAWIEDIGRDWGGATHGDLAAALQDVPALTLQESEKQNRYKLSYYVPADVDRAALLQAADARLKALRVRASLIWSVDDLTGAGLLDVLPERATKHHAVRFLMQHGGFDERNTVVAGDSGNDLPMLTGGLNAVLVGNARDEVRTEALQLARRNGAADRLYLARGALGLNGHYAAGVLEGLAHFWPPAERWLAAASGGASASTVGHSPLP